MFGSNDDKKTPAEPGEKKGLFGWLRKKPQQPVAEQPAAEPQEDSLSHAEHRPLADQAAPLGLTSEAGRLGRSAWSTTSSRSTRAPERAFSAGVSPGAKPEDVSADAIWRMGAYYVPIVLALWIAMIAVIATYRIDKTTHEENLRKLAS